MPDAGLTPPESARDIVVRQAVEHLAPDQSLQRLSLSAQFILSTSALVGGALTGYGVLASDRVAEHPTVGLLALVAASVSFFLAAWSLVGRGRTLNLENEDEVLGFLADEIKSRSWKVIGAGLCFALALPLAGTTALLPAKLDRNRHTLSVVFSSGSPDLVVYGDGGRPGRDGIAEVAIRGSNGRLVGTGRYAADRRGDLRFRLSADLPKSIRKASIDVRIVKGRKELRSLSYVARR